MITKKFNKDFHSYGGALTLRRKEVTDGYKASGMQTKTHDDGWTITGEIQEDYYTWVNDFEATHPLLGEVNGNFEKEVYATSEEAYLNFYTNHKPEAWDYGDI